MYASDALHDGLDDGWQRASLPPLHDDDGYHGYGGDPRLLLYDGLTYFTNLCLQTA